MAAPGVSTDDILPLSRLVRWLVIAGVILLGVGFYFRWGLDVAPVGSAPAAPAQTEAPAVPTSTPTR